MVQPIQLASFGRNRWLNGGGGNELLSAVDSTVVAAMPRDSGDTLEMLDYARKVGGPALRRLSFQDRGKILRAAAEALTARKEELYELSYATGATRPDSAFDIEGGIGVLFVYASKAKSLPDGRVMLDGDREVISKGEFSGRHVLLPLRGAALHINAYNFPVWGMLEKLAPTLLAGVPAIIKPATATAWLTAAAFRILVESDVLPDGAAQLLLGTPKDILDNLGGQDSVAFTGSADTAFELRRQSNIVRESVRFTSEQDSLNASLLGADIKPNDPEFELFVKEVVREMTQKAGQKCTAIRRAFVPAALVDAVSDAITDRLLRIKVGNPRNEAVRMGALAGQSQREAVRRNLEKLCLEAAVVTGGDVGPLIDANGSSGAFLAPTLLRCDTPGNAHLVHEVEAFGPVATLMPYTDTEEAVELAQAGKGSLVLSLFTLDKSIARDVVYGTASSHGRILIVDRYSAAESTGHGAALPHLLHGGPGRAGGGEELGGLIGMKRYMQRTAVQASRSTLETIEAS